MDVLSILNKIGVKKTSSKEELATPIKETDANIGTEVNYQKLINDIEPLQGTYKDNFYGCYGTLNINKNNFSIDFYFPGRDRRYNGRSHHIFENEIDIFIEALQKNWKRLLELSETAKTLNGTRLEEYGERNMRLSASGKYYTLYVFEYNLPLSDESAYKAFLGELKEVTSKAKYIQTKIFQK